ncbi:helicase-related protein [Nonomuraea sp. NPDC049269]|uniref:helicase-related protein n=1 Tax=Nonomuraea sp. NPDC049269 TaxID=3364349 RepID=UPI00371D145D
MELSVGDRFKWVDESVTIAAIIANRGDYLDLIVEDAAGNLRKATLTPSEIEAGHLPANDGTGSSVATIAYLWGKWMEWATPRIRAAAIATKPLHPFPHQDEAVFVHMLPQPRLRFILADEPGTGKTIMTGMYIAEGKRRGVVPGKILIIPPAHLVSKWIDDLRRYFGIDAERITSAIAREPRTLRPDVDVWLVSVDLFTHNTDVLRKVAGPEASWSLVVFDEAHRLTPTSQYLGAARHISKVTHHLLLLTATPHRGKEWYFQSLLNLLDPSYYHLPTKPRRATDVTTPARPGRLHFLRRMKEDLRGLNGELLFKPRQAETKQVDLTGEELNCYDAVMTYVDTWYDQRSILARSIYGKRAASSLAAAAATLSRRRTALVQSQVTQVIAPTPTGFESETFFGAAVEDDEAWDQAETSIISERSRDRRAELADVENTLNRIEQWLASATEPAKWQHILDICSTHNLRPGPAGGQLLVFTEFTDTAVWLRTLFDNTGYSTGLLSGQSTHEERDILQQRFIAGDFQVLISTDAGGEGIDLQSAHVMVDWDIPWSLVRLEQRMGRLHRIGQANTVDVYHLVAPATREGRVQQVLLNNLCEASKALNGRIFDLLDATAERTGFNFTAALADAQAGQSRLVMDQVPSTEVLIAKARELANDEDVLRSPTDLHEAQARFAQDRLEAVNPIMVEGFLRSLADASGWSVSPGPADKIVTITSETLLPEPLGEGMTCLVSVDGNATENARRHGAEIRGIVTIGPSEKPFRQLTRYACDKFESEVRRGGAAYDPASLTDYELFIFDANIERSDGVVRTRRSLPFLIRYSAKTAFHIAWESIANLRTSTDSAHPPTPAARLSAEEAACAYLNAEAGKEQSIQSRWIARARSDLDEVAARWSRQIRDLPLEERRAARERFELDKTQRARDLAEAERVTISAPHLVGWLHVSGGGQTADLGYDPNSEAVAIARVAAELDRAGFEVDDRQSARLGYDLFARHRVTREQRLVEVKGQLDTLTSVTLESHEWGQAMQRGADYWLYIVINCVSGGQIAVRLQDPAGALSDAPIRIQRFRIPVSELRRFIEGDV